MNKAKKYLFKKLFPDEYNELENKKRAVKTLSEKICELKIKLRASESKLSNVTGELTRMKMSVGFRK